MELPASVALSEEEYLRNPDDESCEYVDGYAIEKIRGSERHSLSQTQLGYWLVDHLRKQGGGRAYTGLRCRLRVRGITVYYIPDLCVVLGERRAGVRFLDGAPDLVIEVRSPEQRIASVYRKAEDYFANGTKLAWILLPDEETILVLRPGQPAQTVVTGEHLVGGDVLPGFSVLADELFA
jgi:Uma2 family endonuclease